MVLTADTGNYAVYHKTLDTGTYQLYFEHKKYGDASCCLVYVDQWPEGDSIYEMDLCGVMPEEVGEWLQQKGYNVVWDEDYECYFYTES